MKLKRIKNYGLGFFGLLFSIGIGGANCCSNAMATMMTIAHDELNCAYGFFPLYGSLH